MSARLRLAIRLSLYALVCVLVAGSAFIVGYAVHAAHARVVSQTTALSLFWEAWDLVNQHFYGDRPNETARTYGAIRGSLQSLNDPYTVFVEPRQREREQEELRGSFGGIGALVERTTDGRILLKPMPGRPAAKAGVMAGDELVAVDGVLITSEMTFDDVLARVRGKVGTIVKLTVRREGTADPLVLDVQREEIVTPSVSWEWEAPDVGYIRLAVFNERTTDEFKEASRALREHGAQAFVIDLRNNGGGLVTAAIEVASQLLEDGVVMYERRGNGEERPYPVQSQGILRDAPIAVLVNSGTASASEILAGAIQDRKRGPLIGTKTFGKASVQLLFDLSDGSSLHVTNAHWLTPDRHEIDGLGLKPDVEVELTDQDRQAQRDPQREKAVAYLREHSRSAASATSKGSRP